MIAFFSRIPFFSCPPLPLTRWSDTRVFSYPVRTRLSVRDFSERLRDVLASAVAALLFLCLCLPPSLPPTLSLSLFNAMTRMPFLDFPFNVSLCRVDHSYTSVFIFLYTALPRGAGSRDVALAYLLGTAWEPGHHDTHLLLCDSNCPCVFLSASSFSILCRVFYFCVCGVVPPSDSCFLLWQPFLLL